MDLSTAVNIFLKQMVYENAFPFIITRSARNIELIRDKFSDDYDNE